MKKKKVICVISILLCILLLVVLLQQCGHEDSINFTKPDVSEITYEELLSPPYVVEGVWSFVDLWQLECNGEGIYPENAEENLYIEIAEGLLEVLKGETLYAYLPDVNERAYDKHVKELLWNHDKIPLYLQISAGTLPPLTCDDYDVKPTLVNLYSFDGERCYLTIGYRNNIEIKGNYYVFYTDDSNLVKELFSFADSMIARKN